MSAKSYFIMYRSLHFYSLILFFMILSCQNSEEPEIELETLKPTIKDIEGNEYEIVEINGIWWMAENLRTSTFRNNVAIERVTDSKKWSQTKEPAYSWFENDSNNDSKYGKLYNGYAIACCPICPEGWRLPNSKEVENLSLERFKSQSTFVYQELGWANEYTFSGGYRDAEGHFNNRDIESSMSYFWNIIDSEVPIIYQANLIVDSPFSLFTISTEIRPPGRNNVGAYVRCVKN